MLNFADINQAENVYSKAFSNIISNMENIDIFQKMKNILRMRMNGSKLFSIALTGTCVREGT